MNITTVIMLMIIFFLALQQMQVRRAIILKNKKKRGRAIMANELTKKFIGEVCILTTGSFGESVKGRITNIEENWIEVETKNGIQLMNADFVTGIKQIRPK